MISQTLNVTQNQINLVCPLLSCSYSSHTNVSRVSGSKTGTGTILLQVDDVNDNVPELPTAELVLCEKEGELGSVLVVAEDKDRSPFSSPFTFNLGPDHDGKWVVNRYNGK